MDTLRAELVKELLIHRGYHALICRTPQYVLMFTGYQPLLGEAFCIISLNPINEVEIRLAVPQQEQEFVPEGVAVDVKTFTVETMHYIGNAADAVRKPLSELLEAAGIHENAVIGIEGGRSPIIPAYTQVGVPGLETYRLLRALIQGVEVHDASSMFTELASLKTGEEIAAIKRSCAVAYQGFLAARQAVHVGVPEAEIAAITTAVLIGAGYAVTRARQVQPHVHVMSGPRAALAYRAFNLTSNRLIERGDTVLVQIEVGVNGYWAELTRTFFAESINDTWRNICQTCRDAQDAALKVIHDGVAGSKVDEAARNVMQKAGFGKAFKHGLGHGFGFQAINHDAQPVLHPASTSILHSRMTHNIEPSVYLDGDGGFRLNDDVLVRDTHNEVLSAAIPRDIAWLVVEQ
ncbi:MAG TPA: hypothetical protein DHW02_12405 [Ktedonobacter sp.]|nr:hypothetical protein [Ktedonobacter sp.]